MYYVMLDELRNVSRLHRRDRVAEIRQDHMPLHLVLQNEIVDQHWHRVHKEFKPYRHGP